MVLRCTNGMMITKDVLRQVHLGSKLDHGQIVWSDDTQQKTLALVTAQTRDAVKTFLDEDYVTKVIEGISDVAETEITDPQKTIEYVGKKLLFSEEATAGILTHFIKGGQVTAGGVLQAVTSYAQTVENPDLAFQFESKALEALELAATK
jgi:phosphatidate phosphatase APP1